LTQYQYDKKGRLVRITSKDPKGEKEEEYYKEKIKVSYVYFK